MKTNKNYFPSSKYCGQTCKNIFKSGLVFILLIIAVLTLSGTAHAVTSVKYGWIALDANKKPVLSGSQYPLVSGKARPIAYISDGGSNVKSVNDQSVVYLSNTKVGTAQALILGEKVVGGYKDAFITTFKVTQETPKATTTSTTNTNTKTTQPAKVSISRASVAPISDYKYTGKENKPEPKITLSGKTLVKNKDYTLSYKNHIKAGTATLTITGKGTYNGSLTKTFKIKPLSVKKLKVSKSKLTLLETQKVTIKGTANPKSLASKKLVAWESSNKAVATVSQKGVITARKKGTCYIKFMVMDGTKRCAKCKVTVKSGMDIVKEARKALGVPYVWGHKDFKTGMDCSGLVGAVYERVLGVNWKHQSQTHWLHDTNKFKTIKRSQLKPGDILVKKFAGTSTGHVGIWTGKGVIQESGDKGKCIETINKHIWPDYTPRHYVG